MDEKNYSPVHLKDFTNQYPISKTLRFELRPCGVTMENIRKSNFLEEDEKRAKDYELIKKAIDDFHRRFIDSSLQGIQLNWQPLADALAKYNAQKDATDKKVVESEQKKLRKDIVDIFKKDPRFDDLFSEKLLSKYIFEDLASTDNPENLDAIESFRKFSGYFIGFHENRKNVYSSEDITTSISNRAVNINFSKHIENCDRYAEAKRIMPDAIESFKIEPFNEGIDLDKVFSVDGFNEVILQDGIERYNRVLGGFKPEIGNKIRGLNEFLNLGYQNGLSKQKIRMVPLHKQILSIESTTSFVPWAFESDAELLHTIFTFYNDLIQNKIFERAVELLSRYREYDFESIFIRQMDLTSISRELFGEWDTLGSMIQTYYADERGDPLQERTRKPVNKKLSLKYHRLSDVIGAIQLSGSEVKFEKYISNISECHSRILDCREKACLSPEVILSDSETSHVPIKNLLDSIQKFMHMFSPFNIKDEAKGDETFYSDFNEIFDALFRVVPLYDKTRNYFTKKDLSTKKIKLNFGNPTLASGWDLNKEFDNTAIIFTRGEKYYLGVMNPKDKIKTWTYDGDPAPYKKMVYKLLPGPNKMLPKVFFSKKNIEYYAPSAEILDGYEKGIHKKGDDFDLKFCHKLIEFFKESIEKHPDWKEFKFRFSPTDSYEDISGFYREVEEQGYKITFVDVSPSLVDEYIGSGKLFLFQLYTKDFSERSKGTPNMHTLYWKSAFSEENLKDIVIKLNGEAELFYRKKSDIRKIVVHKKGDVLIGRTTLDNEPIPEETYQEILSYEKGLTKTLSENAKLYENRIRKSVANYDIIKDRRYTEDRMYFHVPLTFNFKSKKENNINRKAIDYAMTQKDLHVIGIDRGERNLVYVTIINSKGEIVKQKSFNTIEKFNYQEKLNQREKERDQARKNWNSIEKIADLKEGYLSGVVHEICKLIIEYNAIVVMEDLNFGFKRGRFKVEKQVYQKFENMLIDKLNYLVFKNASPKDLGGALNAYQLTNVLESFSKLGKQSGILFYVPAAYTSKIDSDTGFINAFNLSGITNDENKVKFIQKMDSIMYDSRTDSFAFSFDYSNFLVSQAMYINKWTVYTVREWAIFNQKERKQILIEPTQKMKNILKQHNIEYESGEDILHDIVAHKKGDPKLIQEVYSSFINSIRMRYTYEGVDKIISPVLNHEGRFFETGSTKNSPEDADANGAFNIARKGALMLELIKKDNDPNAKKIDIPKMEHVKWLEYVKSGKI